MRGLGEERKKMIKDILDATPGVVECKSAQQAAAREEPAV
jgi:hypothetical protein